MDLFKRRFSLVYPPPGYLASAPGRREEEPPHPREDRRGARRHGRRQGRRQGHRGLDRPGIACADTME